jgi:hypothetical protein
MFLSSNNTPTSLELSESRAPFSMPLQKISMEDLSTMINTHRQVADAYILSLSHLSDTSRPYEYLDVSAYLPRQKSPVVIRLQIPSGDMAPGDSERSSLYHSLDAVSFTSQPAALPSSSNEIYKCTFKVQPTLLFLSRAMVLFFEEAGLDQNIVCPFHRYPGLELTKSLDCRRISSCSAPSSWTSWQRNAMVRTALRGKELWPSYEIAWSLISARQMRNNSAVGELV